MTSYESIVSSKACLQTAAKIARALLQKDRLSIMERLSQLGTQTVTELFTALQMDQAECSSHLKPLREIGVIRHTKRGKFSPYQIDQERLENILGILSGLDHAEEDKAIVNGNGALAE